MPKDHMLSFSEQRIQMERLIAEAVDEEFKLWADNSDTVDFPTALTICYAILDKFLVKYEVEGDSTNEIIRIIRY